MQPEVTVILTGSIKDFSKIDNVYTVMKREGSKLLSGWKMEIDVKYIETGVAEES